MTTATIKGMSSRNYQRTGSRNDVGLMRCLEAATLTHISPYYQYCANYRCRTVEAVFSTTRHSPHESQQGALRKLSALLDVSGYMIDHAPFDESNQHPVQITELRTGVQDKKTWGEVALQLNKHQKEHETHFQGCADQYTDQWLPHRGWKGKNGNDLSLSNMLRVIPGVRHLDIDALVYCPDCSSPTILIEASSDGMKSTPLADKEKAVSMSKKISSKTGAITLLVQHRVGSVDLTDPITVTGWYPNTSRPFSNTKETTWTELSQILRGIQRNHVCN